MKYRCSVCGFIQEGELPEGFKCPRCKQPASVFQKIEEQSQAGNPTPAPKRRKICRKRLPGKVRRATSILILRPLLSVKALNN